MFDFLNRFLLIKLIGLAFIAQIIAGVVLLVSSQNAINSFSDTYIEDEMRPIKSLVNSALAPLLFTQDLGATTEQVKQMHNSLSKLKYIVLKDLDGKTLNVSGEEKYTSKDTQNLDKLKGIIKDETYHSSFDITLSGEKVGFIYIGIDLKLQKLLKNTLDSSLILAIIAGVLISSLLIGVFTFINTRRLHQLAQKTKDIADGKIEEDLNIQSKDEIGTLARSFNHMQKKLKKLLDGMYQEIKERKEAEKTLEDYKAHLEDIIEEKTIELKSLNENLEKRVEEEVLKNSHKDKILSDQAKMAAMGEMIGNIAHQWRQPLSVISTASSGIEMHHDMNTLSDKILKDLTGNIDKNTKYLSQTIDTFRNFLKEDKEVRRISVQSEIVQTKEIISAVLRDKHINLIENIDYENRMILNIVPGELSQVIMNIVNNAKDILSEKQIHDPWIKIDLTKEKDRVVICIEDNGGGVPLKVLPHIFEPYFTTKHQSQGTGLGLYMSYKIITESLKGEIWVENTSNGAKFFIELPSNNEQKLLTQNHI